MAICQRELVVIAHRGDHQIMSSVGYKFISINFYRLQKLTETELDLRLVTREVWDLISIMPFGVDNSLPPRWTWLLVAMHDSWIPGGGRGGQDQTSRSCKLIKLPHKWHARRGCRQDLLPGLYPLGRLPVRQRPVISLTWTRHSPPSSRLSLYR